MIYLILIGTLISVYAIYVWLNRGNRPPGPWGWPILGSLLSINPQAPHLTFTKWSKEYGRIYGVHLGGLYTVVLSDMKLIRSVFSKESTTGRAPLYVTHGIMGGYGIICAEGPLWKEQRKFLANFLKNFGMAKSGTKRRHVEELIMGEVRTCIDDLEQSSPVDPLEILRHGLGSIICEMVFGVKWTRDDELWQWLQTVQENGTKLIGVSAPLNFFPILRYLPKFQNTLKFLLDGKHKTHEIYQGLIEEQEKGWSPHQSAKTDNLIRAFLVEREKKKGSADEAFYSTQQFHHLLADCFGAGLDTNLTTLRWYFLYIAHNSDIQKQIHAELDSVVQGRVATLDDIEYLPLLEASIAEAQRIRPVVATGIPHGTLADMEIEGFFIPKRTMIVPLQWAVHMDEREWQHPEQFDPHRFLDDEGRFRKPLTAFMPFQIGKRMCIGDELARMILFLFAATILQRLELEVEDPDHVDFEGEAGITLNPKKHLLRFKCRIAE